MTLIKFIAKRIIIASPPSIIAEDILPRLAWNLARTIDTVIQNWSLEISDNFSKKDWIEIQAAKTGRLLYHAKSAIPFWKEFSKTTKPKPKESLKDLKDLPIISRTKVKQLSIDQLATQNLLNSRRAVSAATSGSTGEPLKFFQDTRDTFRRDINTYQEFRYTGNVLKYPILILGLQTHADLDRWGRRFTSEDLYDPIARKEIYKFISLEKPYVLIGTPSLIQIFASFAEKDARKVTFIMVMYRGEHLERREREKLSSFFHAPLFGNYGTRECSIIGIQCKEKNFHLTPWMNFVEIVDANGQQQLPEVEGEIIVTHFENFVMPFIRYKIGDRGMIHSTPCPCGRQTKTITFTGRDSITVETPSGKHIPFLRISSAVAQNFAKDVQSFQIEQKNSEIIFRCVPMTTNSSLNENNLKKILGDIFAGEMQIKVEKVLRIQPNENGKTPSFIKRF